MRTILSVLLIVICLKSTAQDKRAEEKIGWPGTGLQLHSISDKNKERVCTVVLGIDSFRVFLLDGSLQLKTAFNFPRRENEKLHGGFFRENKLYLFLDNGIEPGLHNWVIDLHSGGIEQHIVAFETNKDKIIDRISCGDHLLYFTINKRTSEFVIYDFTSESKFTTTSHAFDSKVWKELTVSSGLFRSLDVEKVDFEGDCTTEVAVNKSKIYVRDDTLFLLVNRTRGLSRIYTFSLADQKVSVKNISHNIRPVSNMGLDIFLKDNAFLLKDKLYYVYATPDSLGLQIVDFYTGNLLKKFVVMKDEEISFKNTQILQEGAGLFPSSKSVRELEKTRQLLRKMSNGDAALIMATLNEAQQVELTIGSYRVYSGGGGYGGGFRTTSVGGTPVMMHVPTGSFSRNTWSTSARFKMLIDANTGAHIPGSMNSSINEKIEAYTKDIKIPSEAENLFVCNGKYYYAFYDRKERKLCVIGF